MSPSLVLHLRAHGVAADANRYDAVLMKQELWHSIMFSMMPIFDMLRNQLHIANSHLSTLKYCISSTTELLDQFAEEKKETAEFLATEVSQEIGFCDVAFTWSNDNDGPATPSKHLCGSTMSYSSSGAASTSAGKMSLLMALLASPSSWYNLPRGAELPAPCRSPGC
ncbi:hypothetical protein K438DRAFT_1989743 [Mycena galopus ATCC 62051]|nr:hypothetical protein K438DRAFT_1989743 [Mycena galopus ATCC 62051]